MLSFKWILLFFLCIFSNVAAIPRITTQNIELFVGAVGAIGVASILSWHLLKNQKTAEDQRGPIMQSHKDRVPVTHPSFSPTPTVTPTVSVFPSIFKTIVSKGSTEIIPVSMDPSTVPMTRFFAVEAWSNGTIIHVEEIVGFRVGDLKDRHSDSPVTAVDEISITPEELDWAKGQASRVFLGISISEPQPSAINVSSSPWNLASVFMNVHVDRKMKPIIEFARRKFFVVRDFLNKALALFLRLVPSHPAKAAFLLVAVPLVTRFGPAAAKRVLALLVRNAPLVILYLHDYLDGYIGWYAAREEEPALAIETATEPLPVNELVTAPDSQTDAPLEPNPATEVASGLTETIEDDDVEPLPLAIESQQQTRQTACIESLADNEEDSLPEQLVDAAEHSLLLGLVESSPPTHQPENYTATGIFKGPAARNVSLVRKLSSRKPNNENQMPERIRRDQLFSRREKHAAVTGARKDEALLSEKKLEEQAEPSSSQKSVDLTEGPNQLHPAHLVAQEYECIVTSESEKAPLLQSSVSALPCSTDNPVFEQSHKNDLAKSQLDSIVFDKHDSMIPGSFPTKADNDSVPTETECPMASDLDHVPLPQAGQELPATYASESTFTEGQSIKMPSENVDSPTSSNISSTPVEHEKKSENDESQQWKGKEEDFPHYPSVEVDADDDDSPKGPDPSAGILEAITTEEGPEESTDNCRHDNDNSSNDLVCPEGLFSEGPVFSSKPSSDSGAAFESGSALPTAQGRLQELARPSARWIDDATCATGNCTDFGTTDYGDLFDSDSPVSTPSKKPVVGLSDGTEGPRRGGLRSQTRATDTTAGHSEHNRAVTFATESDGSVVSQTCHFRAEEAPAALRESMVIDAQGQQATGVRISTEQPLPFVSAPAGEQQQFNSNAPDCAPGYQAQVQEQPPVASGDRLAISSALLSFGHTSAEYQAQILAELAQRAAASSATRQTGRDLIEATEVASESEPSQSGPHQVGMDDSLSAAMSGLSLQQDTVDMDYEHSGPAHQVSFVQQAPQDSPAPVQPTVQEQTIVTVPGYEPALPAGMDIQQDSTAASAQSGLLEPQLHPAEMQYEDMPQADIEALLAFNRSSTSDTSQAASNVSAHQSTAQQPPHEEQLHHSPLPGLDIHQEVDLEAERREKVTLVKREKDTTDLLPGDEYADIPDRNRATRYKGSGRKILPMRSVYFQCDPSQLSVLLGDSSQQTPQGRPSEPVVNPFANLMYTVTPDSTSDQVSKSSDKPMSGTKLQDRAGDFGTQDVLPSHGSDKDVQQEGDLTDHQFPVKEDIKNQEEMVSQYPPIEDAVVGHAITDEEPEHIAQGQGDPLDDEFEAAQLAYERQRAIVEENRRREAEGGNQGGAFSHDASPASTQQVVDEDEESNGEQESDEADEEDLWDDSDDDDNDDNDSDGGRHGHGNSGGYGHGDSGGHGNSDSGGSQQKQEPGDIEEFDDHDEAVEGVSEEEQEEEDGEEDWSGDDDAFQSIDLPGEEDGFPSRNRIFRELNRLQERVPQPFEIPEPTRIFVNRQRTYVHASVARNIWWCATLNGRDWLWNNWEGIRKEHGWDMIDLCQETVDDHEEWKAQREGHC